MVKFALLIFSSLFYVSCVRALLRTAKYYIGAKNEYEIVISEKAFNPAISIYYKYDLGNREAENNGIEVWNTLPSSPFLTLSRGVQNQPPISNGNFQVNYTLHALTFSLQITYTTIQNNNKELYTEGLLADSLDTEVGKFNVTFTCSSQESKHYSTLNFKIQTELYDQSVDPSTIYTTLKYSSHWDESFHGFGEQFSYFDMTDLKVPVLVSEQGVGRGLEPITEYLNHQTPGVGGYWFTTYAPKGLYLTNYNRSLLLDTPYVSYFDLTNCRQMKVEVEVWCSQVSGQLSIADSWQALITAITDYTGRMSLLPDWTQKGAVVGLEGGTANVTAIVNNLLAHHVPIAGVWLQDWVGLRHSPIDGDRLIWNWELNEEYYPNWQGMVEDWAAKGIRVLTYINPFFSDPTGFVNYTHNYYQEGLEKGYFVLNETGDVYLQHSITITFATLDLTNPQARQWMKDIILNELLVRAGSSGFMCDFGEYLPFDALLYNNQRGSDFHNLYPQAWAELVQEVITEFNQNTSREVIYFMRSAWLQSPPSLSVFWLGDQLQSYDQFDGLHSALIGALTGGLGGQSITHSDLGGYNAEIFPLPSMNYVRNEELLKRWCELGAFGFGLFRTHIGSSTSAKVAQIYSSAVEMEHFAKFANIYANLSSYRRVLMKDAKKYGYPLVRHMALQYSYDIHVNTLTTQYMVGNEILVSPVLDKSWNFTFVWIPAQSGTWIHLWSGNVIHSGSFGLHLRVPSPVSFPPVFYLSYSKYGQQLRSFVVEKGYDQGYIWEYQDDAVAASDDDGPIGSLNMAEKILLPMFMLLLLVAIGWLYTAVYYDKLQALCPYLLPEEQSRGRNERNLGEEENEQILKYATTRSSGENTIAIRSAHNSHCSLYLLGRTNEEASRSTEGIDRMDKMWRQEEEEGEEESSHEKERGYHLWSDFNPLTQSTR